MPDCKVKCTKFDFRDPAGGTYSALSDPVAVFKGPISKGRERKGGGKGEGRVAPRVEESASASVCCFEQPVVLRYPQSVVCTPAELDFVLLRQTWAVSRTLFFYENHGSAAREFSRKCETLRYENSTLAIICPLLLINVIDVTILWAGLAKRSKDISCSRNLVAAHDFYNARRTFYASSYENLVEKSARHASCFHVLWCILFVVLFGNLVNHTQIFWVS